MTAKRWLPLLLVPMLLPACLQAEDDPLRFEGAWIREAPPASPVMAGYVAISNGGKGEVLIDDVESKQFGGADIHEMREINGMMRMRPVPQLRIEPDQTVKLQPGGLHLMLFQPVAALKAGDHATLEFVLSDGTKRAVEFEVRAASE
jgi:copper(I)-binding protein